MSKNEFIDTLRRSISGVSDYTFVNDTIEYYKDYIDTEIRKGRSEEQVLATLGDPRHIAKSILASKNLDKRGTESSQNDDNSRYSQDTGYADDGMNTSKVRTYRTPKGRIIRLPIWLDKVIRVAAIVLGVIIVFEVAKFLLPIALVALAAWLIYKFVRDNLL